MSKEKIARVKEIATRLAELRREQTALCDEANRLGLVLRCTNCGAESLWEPGARCPQGWAVRRCDRYRSCMHCLKCWCPEHAVEAAEFACLCEESRA